MRYGARARLMPWRVLLVAAVIASAVFTAAGARTGAQSARSGTSLRQVATFDLPGPLPARASPHFAER